MTPEGEKAMMMTFEKILRPADVDEASRLAVDVAAGLTAPEH